MIAGGTGSFGAGRDDIYLVKTDSGGSMQWNRTFGGWGDEEGFSVQQTTDGGYIIAGSSGLRPRKSILSMDVSLIKTDSLGETQVVERETSTISCSVSPTSVTQEDMFTVSGAINPVTRAKLILTFTRPDGSTAIISEVTELDGSYRYRDSTNTIGTWNVEASWEGARAINLWTQGASSQQIAFTVEEKKAPVFLREFRDETVLNTFAGRGFMTVFNAWYYSFSPEVASVIATNNILRGIMKILLYPLIGILHITATTYSLFSLYQEFAIIISGLVASSLIGVIYIAPLALVIHAIKKVKVHPVTLRAGSTIWGLSVVGIVAAEITRWSAVMMFSTAIFVLITTILATLSSVKYIARYIQQ
jgi:hypothetical protein